MRPERIAEIRSYIDRNRMRPRVQLMLVELCDEVEDLQSELENQPGEGLLTTGESCPGCGKHYRHHPRCTRKDVVLGDGR